MLWHKNDILQLILDKATSKGESATVITQRLLLVNFAAIHTTTTVSGGCCHTHLRYVCSS